MSNISKARELDKRKDWAYIREAVLTEQLWLKTMCRCLKDAYPDTKDFVAAFLDIHPDADVYDEAFANVAICWGFTVLALDKVWLALKKNRQTLGVFISNERDFLNISLWDSVKDVSVGLRIKPYGPISQFNGYDSIQKFKNGALMEIKLSGSNGIKNDDKIVTAREFFSSADKCAKELLEFAQKAFDEAVV